MNETILTYITGIIAAMLCAAVGFVLIRSLRRHDLLRAARRAGLSFAPADEEVARALQRMDFFPGTSRRYFSNILQGVYRDIPWTICDCTIQVSGGKKRTVSSQTTAVTRERIFLPDFILTAKRPDACPVSFPGFREIVLNAAPAFSQRYLLCAADEAAVRRLFIPEVRRFFKQRNRVIQVIVHAGQLAVYYPGRRIRGQELKAFLDMASDLMERLQKAQPPARDNKEGD